MLLIYCSFARIDPYIPISVLKSTNLFAFSKIFEVKPLFLMR